MRELWQHVSTSPAHPRLVFFCSKRNLGSSAGHCEQAYANNRHVRLSGVSPIARLEGGRSVAEERAVLFAP